MTCSCCWGSHGCDLPAGHDGDHACLFNEVEYVPGDPNTACFIWSQDDPLSFPCPRGG